MCDMEYLVSVIKEGMIIELLEDSEYCIGDREYIVPKGTRGRVTGVKTIERNIKGKIVKDYEIMVRWESGDWVELVPDYDLFVIVFGVQEKED